MTGFLSQGLAFGAIAAVGGMAGHVSVAAGGAEEPFAVGAGFHQFEIVALDAVRAADGVWCGVSYALHSCNQRIAVMVGDEAVGVDRGRLRSDGLGTDHASGDAALHKTVEHSSNGKGFNCMSVSAHK